MTPPVINKYFTKIIPVIFILLFIVTWMTPFNQLTDSNLESSFDGMENDNSNDVAGVFEDNELDDHDPVEEISTKTTDEDYPTYTDDQDTDVQMILNSTEFTVGQTVAVNITSSYTSWQTLNGTMEWTLSSPDEEIVFHSNITMDKVLNTTLVDDNATEIHTFYHAGFTNQSTWNSQVLESTLCYNSTTVQNVTYFTENTTKIVTNTTYFGYMNFTVDLPIYPAILGTWEFEVFLNNTHANGYSSRKRWYNVEFVVTEDIKYSLANTYAERGFYEDNGTIKSYHANETGQLSVYSPGDNITFIGSFAYNTTADIPINTSAFSLSSAVTLFYGEDELSTEAYLRFYDNETVSIPQGNLTAPYNNPNFTAFNFKLPHENIYGQVNITISLTFDYSGFGAAHTVEIELAPISVKYHLYVENETIPGSNTIYVTEKVKGSVTFVTTNWNTTLEENYAANNFTADFLIPIVDLNVEIYQIFDSNPGTELQLFELDQINYTFFWNIDVGIEQQQELGAYTLKLRWLSPGDIGDDTTVYQADDEVTEYEYHFIISEGTWSIVHLTENHNFTIDQTENVAFQLEIEETGFIVNYDRNLTVDGWNDVVFTSTMYEYRIAVTPTTVGSLELVIRWNNGTELGRITLTVVEASPFTTTPKPRETVEAPISNLDLLAFLGVAVTIIVLAVALLKLLPRY